MYTHRPCFYLSLALSFGICLGRYGIWSWPLWSILSGIFMIGSLCRGRASKVFLYLAIVCLGAFYCQQFYLFPSDHIAFLSYQDRYQLQAVKGIIDSDVQTRQSRFGNKQMFELELRQIKRGEQWQTATGRVLVDFFQTKNLHYGDRIVLEGKLHKAFHDKSNPFSYRQYLEDHGLFWILSVGKHKQAQVLSSRHGHWWIRLAFDIRHKLENVLAGYLEPRETAMIQAMILGDRSILPKDMYAIFAQTGTAHILAISGMNMAIITAIVLFILKVLRFPRLWQFILTVIFLFFYALLSGWSASVVRSVFMAAIVLSSFCLEQEADMANSLGIAAIILLVINPLNLFDVGFQLSFLSVGVIIYFCPFIYKKLAHHIQNKIIKHIVQVLSISLVAWVGVSGLTAYYFGMISPIGILANVPIVPLADLVVALGLAVGVVGLFYGPLAAVFAGALKAAFNLTLLLTAWFAQVPGGYFYVHNIKPWQVMVYYVFLMLVIILGRIKIGAKKTREDPSLHSGSITHVKTKD